MNRLESNEQENHENSINKMNNDNTIKEIIDPVDNKAKNEENKNNEDTNKKQLLNKKENKELKNDKKSEDINIANKKQFILFVNISCILTEILILNGFKAFAQMIINGLDKYLFLIHENAEEKNDGPINEIIEETKNTKFLNL